MNIIKKYIAGNFDEYPLWLAGYSRTHLNDLASDAHVLFWQHSDGGGRHRRANTGVADSSALVAPAKPLITGGRPRPSRFPGKPPGD